MNDIIQFQTHEGVPTPNTIAQDLQTAYMAIAGSIKDENALSLIRGLMERTAKNVKAMFDLTAGDDGKIRPRNMGQLLLLADTMIFAGLAPSSYDNKPEKVVIGLLKSMEIGVEPVSGLGNIMIINNRPSVWGDLAQALVERSGKVVKQVKTEIGTPPEPGLELSRWPDDYGWKVETWRDGQEEPYTGTYTVADAKRAGLWANTKKKPWISDPARMLFNRARAFSLRDGFSDCLFGMGIIEEQRDFETETARLARPSLQLPSPADDDEPVTQEDLAAKAPDYGDDKEITFPSKPDEESCAESDDGKLPL